MTPVMQTNSCGNVLLFFVSCVLSHNFIFSRFLGCCPFLGVSNKVETAAGMGLAVTFVMGLASLFTSAVYQYVLYPLQLTYLDTISFILIIAGLVQFVEMFLKKSSPALYKSLGIYLPLITTNCAVLGVALDGVTIPFAPGETERTGLPACHNPYGGRARASGNLTYTRPVQGLPHRLVHGRPDVRSLHGLQRPRII